MQPISADILSQTLPEPDPVALDEVPVRRKIVSSRFAFAALPLFLWQTFFFLAPLLFVITYSFLKKGTYGGVVFKLNIDNYLRVFDGIYLSIFLNSLKIAAGSALTCLLVGFPIAWVMARSTKSTRNILMVGLMLPFLTNCVVRSCAIKIILGFDGPINFLLLKTGLIAEPLIMTDSLLAVWFGMVTAYLPFLVLPIFVSLEKFDFSLLEAARDLGASPTHCFFRILIPLVKPGLVAGLMLVFIPALCEFLLPDFLGGAKNMLIGGLIADQFLKARDWPFGSALSMVLLMVILISMQIQKFIVRRRNSIVGDAQ